MPKFQPPSTKIPPNPISRCQSPRLGFRELLVEFEEFGDALAFGHGLDGEAVGGHYRAWFVISTEPHPVISNAVERSLPLVS